jgi:predicted dehydrogenase
MGQVERRDLLRYAGAAALGTLGAKAAINVIRTGLFGTGHSHVNGKLKSMKNSSDYEVVSAYEPNEGTRSRNQKEPLFQGLRWVSEEELLADPSIHLIVVECRAWEAVPWGKKVIAAGKHLHLEKPPGNAWAPFKELVEEARRKNLLLQTGYMWRCHEGITAAIEAARKGWLGDVYLMRGTINADRNAQGRLGEARFRGGGLFELGGHLIDRTVELLGRPKKVTSWLRHDTSFADELADNGLVVLEFDRAMAVISSAARMFASDEHRSFELIGSDGSFTIQPAETAHPRMKVGMRTAQGPYKAGWQEIELPPQPRFVGDFKELARALKSGQPLKLSYDHELLLHETLLRAAGEMA